MIGSGDEDDLGLGGPSLSVAVCDSADPYEVRLSLSSPLGFKREVSETSGLDVALPCFFFQFQCGLGMPTGHRYK